MPPVTVQVGARKSDQSMDSHTKPIYALSQSLIVSAFLSRAGSILLSRFKKLSLLSITNCFSLRCAPRLMTASLPSCAECGHLLLGDDADPARHQVSEVPRCKAELTEYRRHSLRCLACGLINKDRWPEDMPARSFRPRAQAVVAYLTGDA